MTSELVERAQRGDHEAFDVLATAACHRLYAIARRILRDGYAAEDGAVTEVRHLDLDLDAVIRREAPELRNPESTPTTDPKWSPDSSQLAFALRTSFMSDDKTRLIGTPHASGFNDTSRVAIADADGSDLRLVGPADGVSDFAWSPDGRSLIILVLRADPTSDYGRPMEAWLVDLATGEQAKVGTPAESWQRLAP